MFNDFRNAFLLSVGAVLGYYAADGLLSLTKDAVHAVKNRTA